MVNQKWLPHLTAETATGARGNNLCSYLIALEGWRRGLTLKWYSDKVKKAGIHAPGRFFSLSSPDKTYFFYKSKGDHVSQESIGITKNKYSTKEWLAKKDIPHPEGKRFLDDIQNEEIIQYANNIGFPVVLKPTKGDQGVGVVPNIQNVDHLRESLLRVRANFPDVIVEQYIPGEEFRIFVIEDKVIAALKRIPANVIGDGVHSIKKLIEIKNNERKKNPRLYSCLIKIDNEVKSHARMAGFTLDSIPEKGKQVYLRENSNVSTGGDSVDVTDELPIEIKKIAINTLKAIPGLPHAGVDIIVNPNAPLDRAGFVIEINAVPQIGSLVFPMIGQARDVPGALIDYYFPETKDKKNYNPTVHFNFKEMLQPLISKTLSEVTVIPAPLEPMHTIRYVVSGDIEHSRYLRWIRRKALEADLSGFAQNTKNGNVAIVLAGAEETIQHFKDTCTQWPGSNEASVISEKDWTKPIMVGFEIRNRKIQNKKKSPTLEKKPSKKKMTFARRIKRYLFKV